MPNNEWLQDEYAAVSIIVAKNCIEYWRDFLRHKNRWKFRPHAQSVSMLLYSFVFYALGFVLQSKLKHGVLNAINKKNSNQITHHLHLQ